MWTLGPTLLTPPASAAVDRVVRLCEAPRRALRADARHRTVIGPVILPEACAYGDNPADLDVIVDCAHTFLVRRALSEVEVGVQHSNFDAADRMPVVRSWVADVVYPAGLYGPEEIPVGTWLLGIRVDDDEIFESVQRGDLTGLSIGADYYRQYTDLGLQVLAESKASGVPYDVVAHNFLRKEGF